MPIGNGGIIGPNNTPSTSSAKGVWSIREAMLAQRAGNWPVVQTADPYFEYTTLLLPGNGTNGAQNNTFLDSSTNNFTITRNGNTTQGTFSPFSQTGWGNYFDGTGDYLSLPSNSAFAFGTGAYTIEAWVYLTAYAATQGSIFDSGNANGALDFFVTSTGAIGVGEYGVGNIFGSSAAAVSLNAWNHVAVVRSSTGSNDTKIYVNGTSTATGTDSKNWTVTTTPSVGGINIAGYNTIGYLSNVRVVKGTAVYTANFTPSTTPLTAITNTSLLTCQSNRFVDNSSNAFAITRNGDVSVQAFSPFNPTAAWSAATYGGSGYFDGSGDTLRVSSGVSNQFDPGSAFTFEGWFYLTNSSASQAIFVVAGSSYSWSGSNGLLFQLYLFSNTLYWQSNGNGTAISLSGTCPALNAWHHIAVGYNGTTTRVWVDGVSFASGTSGYHVPTYSNILFGGDLSNTNTYYGYMSNLRFVKGTDVYGANNTTITVPTSPVTAITNTQLLTNFTNAGIYDATSKNDLETVGNAQISTAQSKFGGSSIYVDGTGDVLLARNNTLYGFGTGDFTIEVWVYIVTGTNFGCVIGGPAGGTTWYLEYSSTRGFYFYDNASALNGSASLVTGAWKYLAVSRSGTSLKMFVDGVTTATHTSSANLPAITLGIGAYNDNTYNINGYIQDLRITKGYARYTGTFTPPTTPFQLL